VSEIFFLTAEREQTESVDGTAIITRDGTTMSSTSMSTSWQEQDVEHEELVTLSQPEHF
jgi:hypothetical protein